jgi:peptidoglycan hydrolase-like protein with peptidoglycan-binding domain/DNA invertase Pin-like site-specific DNA recombinase
MQLIHAAHPARLGPPVLALVLAVVGLIAMPAPSHAADAPDAIASAGWHGRAIQKPRPRQAVTTMKWPKGWSAGPVGPGTGYARPGGSKRVREVQRTLVQLGYRPGPIDGLFGPRTRASTLWFQYKHGLPTTGRVNRPTLAVLQARGDGKPLRIRHPRSSTGTATVPATQPQTAPARPAAAPPAEDGSNRIALALLLLVLALGLGVITGLLLPELRPPARPPERPPAGPALNPPAAAAVGPRPAGPALNPPAAAAVGPPPAPVPVPAPAPPAPAPAPRRPQPAPRQAPVVLGYAVVEPDDNEADAVTAAIAMRCAQRDWSLMEVVHDGPQAGRRLAERPGLAYAVRQIRSGPATGLIVARLRDVAGRVGDLAMLLRWLEEAGGFLANHELDTSTRAGQATARALIALGAWERRLITQRTRDDLAYGRFTPRSNHGRGELARQLAAMYNSGLSLRAIADALNLAGFATPAGRRRWQTTDVRAATEEVRQG